MSAADPQDGPTKPITKADVVFAVATPRQRILSWELNGASWAPPMTIAQYVGRETALSETALSANGGTTYYVLHPKDDPETIVSACEVTAKRALVVRGGDGGSAGNVEEVAAYAIASVFTNPVFRERGMASFMLRQVQQAVDGKGAEFGALYSDIGREYYTRLGWKDFRSPQVLLVLAEGLVLPKSLAGAGDGVRLLTADEVAPLCVEDVALVQKRFVTAAAKSNNKDDTRSKHITFLPTKEQMAWHFTRDAYVCKTLLDREVIYRGAQTEDGNAWIYWDHDLREKKLKILRIVTREELEADREKTKAAIKKLLFAALNEAKDWGLLKVLLWEPNADVVGIATEFWSELGPNLSVTFEEREDGSIPSLRWREGESLEGVVWEMNNYYAWC